METNIIEFMNNVEIINKDLSKYTDDKRMFYLNTVNLLPRVDYYEFSKEEYTKAKFEQKIEDLKYNIITIKRPVPKKTITKKEEDKYTIVDSDVAVRQIWNVVNTAGMYKSFTNKEDAFKLANEIDEKVRKTLIVS